MSLRTRITASAAAAGLTAAALVAAGTPVSATPAAHPKKYAKNYSLDAVSTKWVVFTVGSKVYAKRTSGGHVEHVRYAIPDDRMALSGHTLFYPDKYRPREDYYNLHTQTFAVAPNRWTSAAPTGGVWAALDKADGEVHGYEQSERTRAVTDLGVLSGFDKGKHIDEVNSFIDVHVDEHGAVFFQQYGRRLNRASYIAFDEPGTVTPLRTHHLGDLQCLSLSSNALGCASRGRTVYRVPLDGSGAQAITARFPTRQTRRGDHRTVFVTATRTYWGIDYGGDGVSAKPAEPLRSVSARHPHAEPVTTAFTMPFVTDEVATNDTTLYLGHGRSAARGGIYRLKGDHRNKVAFHLVGAYGDHKTGR